MGSNLSSYKVKIVDNNGLSLKHFPVATCYSGTSNRNNKLTDNEGQVSFQSDGKAVDIFVLAPIQADGQPDKKFYKDDGDKDNAYYKIGTVTPSSMPSQLKSPYKIADYGQVTVNYEFYENQTTKKLFVAPFKVKVNYLKGENKDSPKYIDEDLQVKDGKLSILTILHSRIQVFPRKIDDSPYMDSSGKEVSSGFSPRDTKPITIGISFDIQSTSETTKINEPVKQVTINNQEAITCKVCGKKINLTPAFLDKVASGVNNNMKQALMLIPNYLKKYNINTCKDLVNFLAQSKVETQNFEKLIESLNYSRKSYTGKKLYFFCKTAIDKGFARRGMNLSQEDKIKYVDKNLIGNDSNYATFVFGGSTAHPNQNYRGRGFIHLTHLEAYEKFTKVTGIDIVTTPSIVETNYPIAVHTGIWFWSDNSISVRANKDTSNFSSNDVTNSVTGKVNPGMSQADLRRQRKIEIGKDFVKIYGECK